MNNIELPSSYAILMATDSNIIESYTVLYNGKEVHNVAGLIFDVRMRAHEDSTTTK